MLTGKHLIAGEWVAGDATFKNEPAHGPVHPDAFARLRPQLQRAGIHRQVRLTVPHFAVELCRQRLTPSAFQRALDLAHVFPPDEAVRAGFLDEVVPAADLSRVAQERALALAKLMRDAHTATKSRVRAQALATLDAASESDLEDWNQRL